MTGIERGTISLIHPLRDSARIICERYRDLLPDLSKLNIVVPGRHVYAPLSVALADSAQVDTLLLPRITTLSDWAASTALTAEPLSDSVRELQLFEALRGRDWLSEVDDLWGLASELRQLCDELSRHNIGLPNDEADWITRLEAAYRAKAGGYLRFEARLVFEAWHVLADANRVDGVARYHAQLKSIVTQAAAPLVFIGVTDLTPAEQQFVEQYAQRAAVLYLDLHARADAYTQFLIQAWALDSNAEPLPLIDRARSFNTLVPLSPAQPRVTFLGCGGLEQEARAADVQIRSWLIEGKASIAVVIQDRLTARRLRALLERAEVLVQDETGWTLSTVAAATVVMRLLDCVQNDFYYRDALDLLKSPFMFSDIEVDQRKASVEALERLIRQRNFSGGFEYLRALANSNFDSGNEHQMLDRIAAASKKLMQAKATTAHWLDALQEALNHLGVLRKLLDDAAGQQVLELLTRLRNEAGELPLQLSFREFRRWLDAHFERENFRDRDVMSPVVFTHLGATTLRTFDAVILLGADSSKLPPPSVSGPFLNDAVRAELGLPTETFSRQRVQDQLLGLLARSGIMLVTWQADVDGDENLLSPWLERLDVFHLAAFDETLVRRDRNDNYLHSEVLAPRIDAPLPRPSGNPRPQASELMPSQVSVSAYRSLINCPYQFFARYALGLQTEDEVTEALERRDYGVLVHQALNKFHRECPIVTSMDEALAVEQLLRISEREFAPEIKRNFRAFIQWTEWRALIPKYIEWQRKRESEGWRFHEGEAAFKRAFWDAPDAMTLTGRLDRIDRGSEEEGESAISILDYKTSRAETLLTAIKLPGEEVQLSAYRVLYPDATVAQYVAIHGDEIIDVSAKSESVLDPIQERARGEAVFKALRDGEALPAQGDEFTCEYCEASGLCRRKYWA